VEDDAACIICYGPSPWMLLVLGLAFRAAALGCLIFNSRRSGG